MKIFHNLNEYRKQPDAELPTCVTLGKFDGFHLGHQKLISRVLELVILIVYIALVYVVTVFGRAGVDPANYAELFNFDLVGTWVSRFTGDAYDRRELFLNFFMLMPLGVLFPAATKKKLLPTVLFCFLITVSVELLQALTGRGWFELTDIVDNTVGSAIGYGIYRLVSLIWSKLKCKKNN